jgi:general secretion pathway protein I
MYPHKQRGFTLLESVVALAILALTLTVIYQSFGWTVRRSAEQLPRDRAWLTARSLLEQLRGDPSLAIEHFKGQTPQGLRWQSSIEPYSLPADFGGDYFGPMSSTAIHPLQVRVSVSWGQSPGHSVELRSIEFGSLR